MLHLEERKGGNVENKSKNAVSWHQFLKDVFLCSLGAYGGPEAHYGVFIDQLVIKKKYVQEQDIVDLMALCSILPGPTSTQTLVSVGYKIGGPLLAFFTMMVWAFPVLVVMTALSFLYGFFKKFSLSTHGLRYIGPMAVGFIVVAAYRIGKKVIIDKQTMVLFIVAGVTTYYLRIPWIFPLVLILGGVVSVLMETEKPLWEFVIITPPWRYLILFFAVALGSLFLAVFWKNEILLIFERFYRYGYLVFGGGQVLVPLMHSELVDIHHYMGSEEFLTGYGLVQGLPGPLFSFSAYAGGLAARGQSAFVQILGSVAGGVGIFLPGLLLIYFVYPVWDKLKAIRGIQVSLKGIRAVAAGLIAVSAVILMQKSGFFLENIIVVLVTALALLTRRIPAPLLVVIFIGAGFFIPA